MRDNFNLQLENLGNELTVMGRLCEEAISGAVDALMEYSPKHCERVFCADNEIDQKERDIEAICMKLLLKQQPVARDLRTVSSALKMISDMERIGDQCSDIAEITEFIKNEHLPSKIHIGEMGAAAVKMVNDSIDSFIKKDLPLTKAVIAYDDTVDRLFATVKAELLELIAKQPQKGELALDILMIAKYFERIADHAVNIAEWVYYSITGEHR